MSYLIQDDNDQKRLRYLVKRMRQDWAEPLREDVAARLDSVVDSTVDWR